MILMKNKKTLVFFLALPVLTGAVSALISSDSMKQFASLNQPPLSPPGWLFPVVWTVLYILMGAASYLVYESDAPKREISRALTYYGLQLFFNFFWSIFFFNFGLYYFSFAWLIAMLVLIIITTVMFYSINKTAAYLMIPYIIWVVFAGYLNLGVALLN